jgi:hypothetical protein
LAAAIVFTACTAPAMGPVATIAREVTIEQKLDDDGVAMLLPSAIGARFRLGSADPNRMANFQIERKTPASARSQGAWRYWNVTAHDLDYASGGSGKTSRLHIHANGGRQLYTWKNQSGFLSAPTDIRNQEFTAFIRVHGISDAKRAMITLKIRGGAHSAKNPELASCTMMTLQAASTGAVARFAKELTHPIYDYVKLKPKFDTALIEGRWFGVKLISYNATAQPAQVINRLYLDEDPFDGAGHPRNRWKLFTEYIDVEGARTGNYNKLVDWGGWQTTLRSDGVESLDFTKISLREIQPTE